MKDSHRPSDAAVTIDQLEQSSILHFDIQIIRPDRQPRWTRGSRIQMEQPYFTAARNQIHPALGALSAVGDTGDLVDTQLSTVGAVRVEIDLEPHGHHRAVRGQNHGAEQRDLATALARWAWGEQAEELTEFALRSPTPDNSSDRPQLPEILRLRGWHVTDMWLLTSVSPGVVEEVTPWCTRGVRVLYGDLGILIVWHAITEQEHWDPARPAQNDRIHPIALPECRRRHGQLTAIDGLSGADETGRLVQDMMQHHDWTEWQLTQRVEQWERQFFALARNGAFDAHLDARHLGVALDEIHRLLVLLRRIDRDIARRARLGWLPQPQATPIEDGVASLGAEVRARSARMERRLDHLNTSLREGWTLLSSAAAGARLQFDRETSERTQGFQNAAGLVAALVLVPGLVLSLYGAEVEGLPGMGKPFGLVAMLAYAFVGATATFSTLRAMAYRRRGVAALILASGGFILAATTAVLLWFGRN